ncbi:MAG: hypothetical protein HQ559_01720 [Lentisphaerae bacterium]|nr:hypothetical protein [Lentisphaerota bacterium]
MRAQLGYNPEYVARVYAREGALKKAAAVLNTSFATLRLFMVDHNLPRNVQGTTKITASPGVVAMMYHSGLAQREIAEKFGVTRQAVSWYMKAHGIEKGRPTTFRGVRKEEKLPPIDELKRIYSDERVSVSSIARTYGTCANSVRLMLSGADVPIRRRPLGLAARQRDEVARRYKKGYTIQRVADSMGVSYQTMWRFMEDHNIPREHGYNSHNRGERR